MSGGFVLLGALISGYFALRSRRATKSRVAIVDATSTSHAVDDDSISEDPPSASVPLGVKLTDIGISNVHALDHPVLDVQLVNRGGQSAYLTRLTVTVLWARKFNVLGDLLPYVDKSHPWRMPASATYDVELPVPGSRDNYVAVGISQVIAGGEADRFNVRLKAEFEYGSTSPCSQPAATSVYILRATLKYDNSRQISSRPIGVACPGNTLYVPTADGLRRNVGRFYEALGSIQRQVNREMSERGTAALDWQSRRARRADIPGDLEALNGVNDTFWNPREAVQEYLMLAERCCREISRTLRSDMPDGLGSAITVAEATIQALPQLRAEFASVER